MLYTLYEHNSRNFLNPTRVSDCKIRNICYYNDNTVTDHCRVQNKLKVCDGKKLSYLPFLIAELNN